MEKTLIETEVRRLLRDHNNSKTAALSEVESTLKSLSIYMGDDNARRYWNKVKEALINN